MLCIKKIEQKLKELNQEKYQIIILFEEKYNSISARLDFCPTADIIKKFEEIQQLNIADNVAVIYQANQENTLTYNAIKYISTKVNKLLLIKL